MSKNDYISNVTHGLHTARFTGLATNAILSVNEMFFMPTPMIDNI